MPATRIISLVPSLTELLFDLGLNDEVVGITKFCIHPQAWFKTKQRVGGTKKVHFEIIHSLHPDLIIANKEENTKEDIEALAENYSVYLSDIRNVSEALEMILSIGEKVGRQNQAAQIVKDILTSKQENTFTSTSQKALYIIWQNPVMAAGIDTFIHSMMQEAGFVNCLSQSRYPVLSVDEIKALNPDVVLLSSEPFPFKQKHIDDFKQILPHAQIILVDGELFSWYGSRMLKSFDYFSRLHASLL
ncbi:MAG: ABC transporter substrate-binding protein [Bacteroidetes bacterium]|nr:ABC transporter substrate-binding protein [Bacteroidota bacterium]